MKTNYQIPFDSHGNLLQFAGRYRFGQETIWKDNFEFEDTLSYVGHEKSGSSANLRFKSKTTGCTYYMFITDVGDVINSAQNGEVTGRWTFRKYGEHFGVRLVRNKKKNSK